MHETMAMDLAIETAFNMTNPKDTLIIVTADHGHTMSMAGYQLRGADIRGIQLLPTSFDICACSMFKKMIKNNQW